MPRKKIKSGDLFRIKIENKFAFGQCVAISENDFGYYIIFDYFTSEDAFPPDKEIIGNNYIIFSQITNERFKKNIWQIYSNMQIRADINFPLFKVSRNKHWEVEDWAGNFVRIAKDMDVKNLKFRETFSSFAVEYAIKVYLGLEPKDTFSDQLLMVPSAT